MRLSKTWSLRAWWLRRTLRFRITLVSTGVAVVCLLALAQGAVRLVSSLLVNSVDTQLHKVLDTAAPAVAAGQVAESGIEQVRVRVLDSAGNPLDGVGSTNLADGSVRALKAGSPVLDLYAAPPRRWIGTVVTAPDGTQRLVVASTDLVGYAAVVGTSGGWFVLAALLGGAVVGLSTWLVVRWSLRPVERMRLSAGLIPAGRRLPVPEARDELRALAEALNSLLARRDDVADRLRRFTGDAAHELRSPVASIRAQAEVALLHPDPECVEEVLRTIEAEAERMSVLVDDLLTLARADAGRVPPAERVDLVAAARAAVERLPAGGVRVRLDAPAGQCSVLAAPGEIALVLDNLLRNASRYARALVTVLVHPVGDTVRLVVDDDGPGVPPEHRAQVFDRFYRVQDDRGRGSGGAGLGLALVAEAARRRGGLVRVSDSPDGGARLEVRWPTPDNGARKA